MEKNEKNASQTGELLAEMKSCGISELELNENGKKFSVKYRMQPKATIAKQEPAKKEPEKPAENYYTLKSRCVGHFHIFKYEEAREAEKAEKIEQEESFLLRFLGKLSHYAEKAEETKKSAEHKAEPFVRVGGKVGLEDVLGTIESMKLQNDICLRNYKDEFHADYGIIREILKGEGEPVEYGAPLFIIEPCK